MSDETTQETPEPKRKRGRPKKVSTTGPQTLATPIFAGMAERHPIAYAVAVLRLISNVSTEDEVRVLANASASELEAAAK